ncbi:MAG: MAPEG family protein [Sandaracinaceae bacterium]
MTTDLWMLVGAAALHFALVIVAAGPGVLTRGVAWGMGNREDSVGAEGWVGRAKRASANLMENLPLFIIVVLVAHVSGHHNSTTALGAMIFLGARAAHAAIYIAGVPWVRTASYVASLAGIGLIASQLVG